MVLCRVVPMQVLVSLLGLLGGCRGLEFRNRTEQDVPGWSVSTAVSITGWRGGSTVLPCTFTDPGLVYKGRIHVTWFVKRADGYTAEAFYCSFLDTTTAENEGASCLTGNDQYRLVGEQHQNNVSLEIRNLTLNDSGSYTCTVGLSEVVFGYPTDLLVIEPPNEADQEDSGADLEVNPEQRASFYTFNAVQVAQIGALLLSLTLVSILCRSRSPRNQGFQP